MRKYLFALPIGLLLLLGQLPAALAQQSSCTVSGNIYGSDEQSTDSLALVVINPENGKVLGQFSISEEYEIDLSDSDANSNAAYRLKLFRPSGGSNIPVSTDPRQHRVDCSQDEISNVNFALQ